MNPTEIGSPWIWHPDWVDHDKNAAGGFVHFRKRLHLSSVPATPIPIHITADTRYRLCINSRLVCYGPVKGDEARWFYDTVDIQPFLTRGDNLIAVIVLRYFHATKYATTFARMPIPGLYVRVVGREAGISIDSDSTWEAAIDCSSTVRVDEKFDWFLNIFEKVDRRNDAKVQWKSAQVVDFNEDWGVSLPWRLYPRMIPQQSNLPAKFTAVHNVRSTASAEVWRRLLDTPSDEAIRLPPGTKHHIELETENYLTALLAFRFSAKTGKGSSITITYSECYEDEPHEFIFARRKGNRRDATKKLIGPSDLYILGGDMASAFGYHEQEPTEEVFRPFHYRAFRFIAIDIDVCPDSELVINGIDAVEAHYPIAHRGSVQAEEKWVSKLWEISVRTLENCMHDCYEDCPFYEQLQYPMDTRSSSLFTYLVSGDDRLARQAMTQMHDTFMPSIGLVTGRTGSSILTKQFITPFSLYWVNMIADHYEYYADDAFVRQFVAVCDAVLETFTGHIDQDLGLVCAWNNPGYWEYTDWTRTWAPQGVPPAYKRTGFSTYINLLYVYTLRRQAWLLCHLKRPGVAQEYEQRADAVGAAVLAHCFDGHFFTDGLSQGPLPAHEFSQHCQVWAVLAGVVTGDRAARILDEALAKGNPLSQASYDVEVPPPDDSQIYQPGDNRLFTETSVSFKFYVIRALSVAGEDVYNKHFHKFWDYWRAQVANNVSTWPEDSVCVRSDCHAWGSVPIHEFITEVAGVKPAKPGWRVVAFKPRLQLFSKFEARVPIQGKKLIHVRWFEKDDADQGQALVVKLRLETEGDEDATVLVTLPDRKPETITLSTSGISYEVILPKAKEV
ncbi:hypothetical protein FDECE_7081 [Fusarium decemcellulare]|nr:hypothetical protein FDECE_7081 [Fusarium decemcellulare]